MEGIVNDIGEVVVHLPVAGRTWPAIIDTGFNGDLELPEILRPHVQARFLYVSESNLAAGQTIEEALFAVEFPFDGTSIIAEATFVPGEQILIGTHLLRGYHLDVHFPHQAVLLERVA